MSFEILGIYGDICFPVTSLDTWNEGSVISGTFETGAYHERFNMATKIYHLFFQCPENRYSFEDTVISEVEHDIRPDGRNKITVTFHSESMSVRQINT
jgi:hypothetical protein